MTLYTCESTRLNDWVEWSLVIWLFQEIPSQTHAGLCLVHVLVTFQPSEVDHKDEPSHRSAS